MYVKIIPYGEKHQGNADRYECQQAFTRVIDDSETGKRSLFITMERESGSITRELGENEQAEIYFMNNYGQTWDSLMWMPIGEGEKLKTPHYGPDVVTGQQSSIKL